MTGPGAGHRSWRSAWQRIAPWLTPTLVVVEVILVWSGRLGLGTAVAVGLAVEVLLWVTALSRAVAGVRRFRAGRAAGQDGWQACEDGLAQLLPRGLARVLLLEPRLWVCLSRWLTGRYPDTCDTFRYGASVRMIFWVAIGLVVVEGAAVDLVLALAIPGSAWIWVALGVHLYALIALLGLLGSILVRPHLLGENALRIRDAIFCEVTVPYAAITGVRATARPNFGRSGLRIDAGQGLLAYGDATVSLDLDPNHPVLVTGRPEPVPLARLDVTADEPEAFVSAVRGRTPAPGLTRDAL